MIFSKRTKFSVGLASAVICSLLMTGGCAPPGGKKVKLEAELEKQAPKAAAAEPVRLALKFTPGDSTTYKITTQAEKNVKWEGSSLSKANFKDGSTGNRVEMTFTQQIQSVDDKGNAIAKITIEGLKYLYMIKDNPVLDFDSFREKDRNNPLAKLIGQSYTIEIAPAGKVIKVVDVKQAQAAVKGNRTALELLSFDAIKKRHETLALPDSDKNQLRTGDNWSSIKSFSFGLMGPKSYEKIYTLKEIKNLDNQQIAVVEMNAIPTSEMAEQLYKEQATSDLIKMFDNTETYTGLLKLNLTAGKVEKWFEELRSEWVIIDPSAKQQDDSEPAALKMGVTRISSLEKID